MLSWQERLSHDTKHVRTYRELSNIHTILPFPPQLACNLIYLVTLQPPLSAILHHANCNRHDKMYHNNHSYTHQWTTIKLQSVEPPQLNIHWIMLVMMTIQRNWWLCTNKSKSRSCCFPLFSAWASHIYIYPCLLSCRGLFPYRIEPYILRQCLFSLILFIWF